MRLASTYVYTRTRNFGRTIISVSKWWLAEVSSNTFLERIGLIALHREHKRTNNIVFDTNVDDNRATSSIFFHFQVQ